MSIPLRARAEGCQRPIYRVARITFEDFDGVNFLPVFEIPGDAIVLGGHLVVETEEPDADGPETVTMEAGVESDPDLFMAATDLDVAGLFAVDDPAGAQAGSTLVCGLTPSHELTAFTGFVVLKYIRKDRSQATQG